jgi:hypothetical protein
VNSLVEQRATTSTTARSISSPAWTISDDNQTVQVRPGPSECRHKGSAGCSQDPRPWASRFAPQRAIQRPIPRRMFALPQAHRHWRRHPVSQRFRRSGPCRVPRAQCPHWAGSYKAETRSTERDPRLRELLDPARRRVLVAHDNRCVSGFRIPIRRAFSRSPLLSTQMVSPSATVVTQTVRRARVRKLRRYRVDH